MGSKLSPANKLLLKEGKESDNAIELKEVNNVQEII
jgi:hypothetical protein